MIESYLQIFQNTNEKLFSVQEKANGLFCDIYYPIINPSVYGKEDSTVVYPDNPDEAGVKRLIFNIVQETKYTGNLNYDSFFDDPIYLLTYDKAYETGTKVIAHLGSKIFAMKVDGKKAPGTITKIVKHILVPYV